MVSPIILNGTCMSDAPREQGFRDEELLADVIARLIGSVRHVAVGNASPIPATAALLARERGSGHPYVSLLQSRKHNFFTDGARELFDCAGQGRIDVFFLSGGQIDGRGNVNLVSIGDYGHPKVRFPGSFGSAYLYYVVPKVILFRTEHSRRTLVPKVDFISAPGTSEAGCLSSGRTDRVGDQSLSLQLFKRVLHPGERAPGPYDRGDCRKHRIRFREAGLSAGNAGTDIRDPPAHARGRCAAIGRGLPAIHGAGLRCHAGCFRTLKIPRPFRSRNTWASLPPARPAGRKHHKKRKEEVW